MTLTTVSGLELRNAVGAFPSGVTVVSTEHAGVDYGLTVSAFVSLSLDPAMVLVSVDKKSRVLPFLCPSAPVAVSVLAEDQADVAITFGRSVEDKFAGLSVVRTPNGARLIDGAAAALSGRVVNCFDGGDHDIITIAVEECSQDDDMRPLLYHRGKFLIDKKTSGMAK